MSEMIPWRDAYCIGNDLIDSEHKKLFEMANQIFHIHDPQNERQSVMLLLNELYDYIQSHFQHEESFLKNISYPLRNEQKKEHQAIIKEMNQIVTGCAEMNQLCKKMNKLMSKWLLIHIIKEDGKIPHTN